MEIGVNVDDDGLDSDVPATVDGAEVEASESEKALVKRILQTIREDKSFFKLDFERMRNDMFMARYGYEKGQYPATSYKANLAGRHVKQKSAALYAKNPKITARRRETLDFAVWDENPQSLQLAFQTVQQLQQQMAAGVAPVTGGPQIDPATGQMVEAPPSPEEIALNQAMATIKDFQDGTERRKSIGKIGKTLEILFSQAMREQKPVDFKTGMKQLVRRVTVTGVGYVELGFQRTMGPRPDMTEKLADARSRLDHLRRLSEDIESGDITAEDPEVAELQMSVAALQSEPEIVLQEGLVFDYPQSTRVIPDRLTTKLTGFVGARHISIEYLFTPEEVQEIFGVDLKKNYHGYSKIGSDEHNDATMVRDDSDDPTEAKAIGKGQGLVCVWKHYDKSAGLTYYVVDGYEKFLRPPAAPDVFVEDFWPLYALTFNDVENETAVFPLSDVALMRDMQSDYNRSRQGAREHRKAARPRWVYSNASLNKNDMEGLGNLEAFEALGADLPPQAKIGDVLQVVPVPGVDPNLYQVAEIFNDIQLVVGSSEAQMGGLSKATATESAIAAGSAATSDGSSIDDLDAFLTVVARGGGQILLREMSPEQVTKIAGPGAVWPPMTLADVASEIFLEVEAGSTGKPNQATEVNNWQQLLPYLIQMPGVDPLWLAKETIRRLDDRIDITEAISAGIPSIVMQNQAQQPGTGDPATDPTSQGGQGASNAPQPPEQGGSDPAFGSNQV